MINIYKLNDLYKIATNQKSVKAVIQCVGIFVHPHIEQ